MPQPPFRSTHADASPSRRRLLIAALAAIAGFAVMGGAELAAYSASTLESNRGREPLPPSAVGAIVQAPQTVRSGGSNRAARATIHEDLCLGRQARFQWGTGVPGAVDPTSVRELVRVTHGAREASLWVTHNGSITLAGADGSQQPLRPWSPAARSDRAAPDVPGRVERSLRRRPDRPRTLRALFLYTLRALADAGGSRRQLRERLSASLTATNDVYAPHGLHVTIADVLPVVTDDHRTDCLELCVSLADPTSERFGRLAADLVAAIDVDRVCLIASAARSRDRAYALRPGDGDEDVLGFLVVRVSELAHDDLTLAHEFGHTLGLGHSETGDVMARPGKPRRRTIDGTPFLALNRRTRR